MTNRLFGVSTHLFHEHRLSREHLVHIAAHGFEAVEVFATRSHFDYRDDAAVQQLIEWLGDTRLTLHSLHAPVAEARRHGQWVSEFSIASGDETRRKAAVAEIAAVIALHAQLPYTCLVVHPGVASATPGDNQPGALIRSLESLMPIAADAGVRLALEVIPNALASAAALVRLIDDELDGADIGICLDFGHAHIMGDLAEALEIASGHLWTTHVHDNRGTRDEHLVPFAGSIDWDLAMMETQKVGYDGVLLFEVADTGDPVDVLRRTVKARERLEEAFITFE